MSPWFIGLGVPTLSLRSKEFCSMTRRGTRFGRQFVQCPRGFGGTSSGSSQVWWLTAYTTTVIYMVVNLTDGTSFRPDPLRSLKSWRKLDVLKDPVECNLQQRWKREPHQGPRGRRPLPETTRVPCVLWRTWSVGVNHCCLWEEYSCSRSRRYPPVLRVVGGRVKHVFKTFYKRFE